MPRRKPKSHILRNLCVVALAMTWAFGAGRAKTSTVGWSHWNPLEQYRKAEARQFEKRLARQIYGNSCFGHYGFGPHTDSAIVLKHFSLNETIYGKTGLAEFNGIEGIQAEEYVRAIKKIYNKDVTITPWNLRNRYGRNVLGRLSDNTSIEKLEQAIINWNGDKSEEPKIGPYKQNIDPRKPKIIPGKPRKKVDYNTA